MIQAKQMFFILLAFAIINVGFFSHEIMAKPYPPISSDFDLRIVNRQYVSHIVFEKTEDQRLITIILTNGPIYHAWHSTSYPLHYQCNDCLKEARKLDQHLKSGWNLGLKLNGSTIEEIVYLMP